MSRRTLARSAMLIGLAMLATFQVWRDLFTIAWRDEEASHLFAVPLISIYLLFCRPRAEEPFRLASPWVGLPFLLAGAAFHYLGLTHSITLLWHASAVVTLVGAICVALGTGVFGRAGPSLAVLVFMIPLPGLLRQQISLPLQHVSATVASASASWLGVPVEQAGYVLAVDGTLVSIVEACNGMRMLIALVLVVFAFCFSLPLPTVTRVLLLAASPVVALALNIFRLVSTVLLYGVGPPELASQFHDASGWLIPLLAIGVLVGGVRPHRRMQAAARAPREPRERTSDPLWVLVAGFVLLGLVATLDYRTYQDAAVLRDHHTRVRRTLNTIPYAIDDWIALDSALHAEEYELLKPNAAFRRTYRNVRTGEQVTVFAVATWHARDLVGHEPGVCYVGQGWSTEAAQSVAWQCGETTLHGRNYVFAWPNGRRPQRCRVASLIILPTGSTTGMTSDLAESASDCRKEPFGAGAVQLATTYAVSEDRWNDVARRFFTAFLPLADEFRFSGGGTPRARKHPSLAMNRQHPLAILEETTP